MYTACYEFPVGTLQIQAENDRITAIRRVPRPGSDQHPSRLTELAAAQLREYFEGSRKAFDLPLAPDGTPFQQEVWHALTRIPWGKTRTYRQIACDVGSPNAARAVGQACSRNPIWIVIPCHRVIGSSHSLTGYAGGVDMKQQLLELEGAKA